MESCSIVGDVYPYPKTRVKPQQVSLLEKFKIVALKQPLLTYFQLSPALRNRMTEVWCDVIHEVDDLIAIVEHSLNLRLSSVGIAFGTVMMLLKFTAVDFYPYGAQVYTDV